MADDKKAHDSDYTTAQENWQRYRYGLDRGHRIYTNQAGLCDRMYLGGGRQWDPADLAVLAEQKRPAYEFNEIKPAINAALGYQLQNRMDIALRPRGEGTDQEKADIRSKILMQIADQTRLPWKESEVFSDGLIQQRGYFDVRVDFDSNMRGSLAISTLDPMDVIPDPDAKTYDPAGWADVIVTRWLTYDEIAGLYGQKKADELERARVMEGDYGESGENEGAPRHKFADPDPNSRTWDSQFTDGAIKRVRVIDRQCWKRVMSKCLFYPRTGDLKLIENFPDDVVQMHLAQGAMLTKSMQKRVRWIVSTYDTLLHDELSPYPGFTIIPYFPFFRRGQTSGLVDDAIGPQQALNKGISQFVHIINTSANSGWNVEENSLTNMSTKELESKGAMTGLVLESRVGSRKPEKITANDVPQGIDRMIDRATAAIRDATVPEAMRGITGPETAGIAIQSKQHAAMMQLAVPLDNLMRTRHMLVDFQIKLIAQFYTDERVFRITEQDPLTGKPIDASVTVNQWDELTGTYMNDLTESDYDTVISEQPQQGTFENSQFQQALELRKVGVAIPDAVMVQHSALTRKTEIVEQLQAGQPVDPTLEAKAKLIDAQTRKTIAEGINKNVEGMYSATQAANQIAMMPQVAPLADAMLRSAGYEDADEPPIVPGIGAPIPLDGSALPPTNTNPLTPANPAVGMKNGIERMDTPLPQ